MNSGHALSFMRSLGFLGSKFLPDVFFLIRETPVCRHEILRHNKEMFNKQSWRPGGLYVPYVVVDDPMIPWRRPKNRLTGALRIPNEPP